jgi:hypothetical protein
MPGVSLNDLPPKVRARVVAHAEELAAGVANAPSRALRIANHGTSRWRCAGCGVVFTQWAPAQRHSMAGCNGRHSMGNILDKEA